ncbi:MAG: VOC family protein [Novosphingobium sp.]|nr:VOC family protein [Novosphingobium sp.]
MTEPLTQNQTGPLTHGAHHVGLAVPDIEVARSFFCEALGYKTIGGVPDYPAHFVSDGTTLITLWQVSEPASARAFDRKRNIGLHHLALTVADDDAIEVVYDRVRAWPGTSIEFAPVALSEGSSVRHFICAIPGGVRIEFATPFG